MPDTRNPADGAGADGGDGDASDPKDKDGAEDNADADGGEGDDGDDDGADGDDDDKDDDIVDDEVEPATRKSSKSVKDHIIDRKNKKIKKLAGKDKDGDEGGDDGDGDGDDVNAEDEELIGNVVKKILAPHFEEADSKAVDADINAFLADNPDFKKYEKKVRRFAAHDSRSSLPIESVFYEVAGPDLLKMGAKRNKNAGDEAKKGRTGGGSNRSVDGGKKTVDEMSPKEFAIRQQEVRSKQRD